MKYIKIYEDYLDEKPQLNTSHIGSNRITNMINTIKGKLSYKEFIDRILKAIGYNAKSLLAYGLNGVAIELENNQVLKLTTDMDEIINSYKLLNINSEFLININYVCKISQNGFHIGVIVMEKLNPLNINLKNILGKILIDNHSKSPVTLRADIIQNAKKYDISKDILNNLLDILSEMSKYNLSSYDLHGLNLAISDNGKIKAFDFGSHTFYKKSVINEVPEIHYNKLIEKLEYDVNSTWFHVSPIVNRDSILTNGLTPTYNKRYIGISKKGVYLWKYKELALWYALTESRDFNKNFDIFEITQDLNI